MIPVRFLFSALCLAAAACVSARSSSDAADAGASVPTARAFVELQDGRSFGLKVEVAANDADRARGLMFRRSLGADEGMIFVFAQPGEHRFWMHNVYIPLDMVFAAEDGRVLGVVHRAGPLTDTSRGVPGPAKYVLEVIGGWCGDRGVKAGDRLRFEGLDGVSVR